jgi:hypothetical protein
LVAAKIANLKDGQKKSGAPRGAPDSGSSPPEPDASRDTSGAVSQSDAAAQLDVSRRSVQRAAQVLKEAESDDIKALRT